MMVGLSAALDSTKGSDNRSTFQPHAIVLSKANMIKPFPSPAPPPPPSAQPNHPDFSQWNSPSGQVTAAGGSFLDQCFLCQQKLLPGKDIFMYKGDRAFCSEECRCRQIFMDDKNYNLAVAPMKQSPTPSSSSSPSSPNRKRTKNHANRIPY